jgi:hypothetical protein
MRELRKRTRLRWFGVFVVEARKNWIRERGLNDLRGQKVKHRIVLGAAFSRGLRQIT